MGASPDIFHSARRRFSLPLSLLVVCLASAPAAAAPAQAPVGHDPRPLAARSEPHVTTDGAGQGASREETAQPAPAGAPRSIAQTDGADSRNFKLIQWLVGAAVTLGLVAVTTALLLARTQSKLEAANAEKDALEKRFKALYNHAPNGFHTLDLNGVVVGMNDTEIGWLGYMRDEIIGKRYAEFLADSSRSAFSKSYEHLLRGDQSEVSEQRQQVVGREGRARWLSLTPSLVRDERGRLTQTLWSAVDISERVRLEEALETEAHFDRVTNAHNRAFFFTIGEREISRVRRGGGQLALLYVDVDDFARINTLYGHFGGDRALKTVCGAIAESLRNVDIFARIGDDEFAILLPDVNLEGVKIVVERLKKKLAATPIKLSSDEALQIRVSIGISEYSASTPNLDALLGEGERALERVKRARQAELAHEPAESTAPVSPAETPAA